MARQLSTRSQILPASGYANAPRFVKNTTQFVNFPSQISNNFNKTSQYTWMGWLVWDGSLGKSKIGRIFTKGSSSNGIRSTLDTGGWYLQNLNTFTACYVRNPFYDFVNIPTHFAITYDGLGQAIAFYINGEPYSFGSVVSPTFWTDTNSDTTSAMQVGSNFANEAMGLAINDFLQINSLLSPAQILDAFQNKNYAGSIAIHAQMVEASGNTVVDISGNNNNGTLQNGASRISSVYNSGRTQSNTRSQSALRSLQTKNNRVNPFGLSCHLNSASGSEVTTQLNLMAAAGVRWIRYDFELFRVEATQGVFNWSVYDNIVNSANALGINTIALIVQYSAPSWALDPTPGANYMTSANYQAFCQAIATRYGNNIKLYELGNEPNGGEMTAATYINFLQGGYTGVKAGSSSAKVLTAGFENNAAPTYLSSLYGLGAKGYFDYLALHPYGWPSSPDYSFQMMDQCRAVMAANGDGDKKVIITEVGWPTDTGGGSNNSVTGVSENIQSKFIQRAYQKIMFEDYGYVPILCIYDFKNDGGSGYDPTYSEDNFGIIRADESTKPAYTAYQQLAIEAFPQLFNEINP